MTEGTDGGSVASRPKGPIPTDATLVRRAKAGEADAFEPLVLRYSNTIVRFAHHMVSDYQAAEDIAQETFLKAYSHLGRLGEPERFATWLYSITRHLCLDWLRASSRRAISVETLSGLSKPGEEGEGQATVDVRDPGAHPPDEAVALGEMHGRVLAELQELRPDYREILLMKHVYEFSYKQISETVGLSVSAVGEKLSRVRQMLRRRLKKQRLATEGTESTEGRPL